MSNDWDLELGAWKDNSLELGRKVETFLDQNALWVVYGRRDERFKCPDHYSQEGHSPALPIVDCALCHGFGVKTVFEVVPCRFAFHRGVGATEDQDEMGASIEDHIIVDFPRYVRPQRQDLVFMCEWAVHTQQVPKQPRNRPTRITTTYRISQININHEREILLFNCAVELYEIETYRMRVLVESAFSNMSVRSEHKGEWKQDSFW